MTRTTIIIGLVVLLVAALALTAAAVPESVFVPFARRAARLEQWTEDQLQGGDNCQLVLRRAPHSFVALIWCEEKVSAAK